MANIIEDTKAAIDAFKDALNKASTASTDYITLYDKYNEDNVRDAKLLKEKMKNIVVKAVSLDE